jgi:hypothetical protein
MIVDAELLPLHGVLVPQTDPAFTPEILRHMKRGSYELAEARALWHVLRDDDRLLELGTGCGFLAAFASLRLGSAAVLTVEADPKMAPTIRATFAANGVSPLLMIAAVGDGCARRVDRAVDFWATRTAPLDGTEVAETVVDGIDLRTLLARHLPAVVVIDNEGGELALCGVPLPAHVRALVVETHGPECARAVDEWLLGQGFLVVADWESTSPDVTIWRRRER